MNYAEQIERLNAKIKKLEEENKNLKRERDMYESGCAELNDAIMRQESHMIALEEEIRRLGGEI